MSRELSISLEGVSKKYCLSLKRSMFYGMADIARDLIGASLDGSKLRPSEFWAIRDLSFSVAPAETIGVIGPNGAGKSTLLKLLSGIFLPDTGRIRVRGRIGTLIEVGAGFHPLLTGRENIYVNGAILGLRRHEIDRRLDDIIAFAGLEEFIDTPVRHYSSGMFVRLGFAVAIHAEPDILIVDEALAVGDIAFHAKCMSAFHRYKERGVTVLLVSHDLNTVKALCDRAIYLNHGHLRHVGEAAEVVETYVRETQTTSQAALPLISSDLRETSKKQREAATKKKSFIENPAFAERVKGFRHGSGEVCFTAVEMLDESGCAIKEAVFGQKVRIKLHLGFRADSEVAVSYYIRDDKHLILAGSTSVLEGYGLVSGKAGDGKIVEFATHLPFGEGAYNLLVILSMPVIVNQSARFVDYVENACVFRISPRLPIRLWSKVYLPNSLQVRDV